MSKLVIVESPTKIKKIQQFLPPGFVVDSCVGHIRDLPGKKSEIPAKIKDEPWADYGVNVDDGFKPVYITIRGKGKIITQLKQKLKNATELYLATDEDREGEAIAWHLVQALNPKIPVKRMVFNEITKKAVLEALENPREMDNNLVQAQETRRILDRLYGYALSPLLWKKVGGNLSAGRVQSVAVRLVVMRERERRAFVKGSYWGLTAGLNHLEDFEATLTHVDGKRVATGKDFDKDTGRIQDGKDVLLIEEAQARDLAGRLQSADWRVADVKKSNRSTKPAAPFITSTLQQEANNRLGFGARRTMDIAQRLYQEGHITYMRTDSTLLSEEALEGAKNAITDAFGAEFYAGVRSYGNKSANAQEAHEAIRPSGEVFARPDGSGLSGDELRLYSLIWKRTLASQMKDEESTHTSITLESLEAQFSATGKHVDFAGWRKAYPVSKPERDLPPMAVGDAPQCKHVDAEGHETKPPSRFTEASLVKALEEQGIGRPSTYASILDVVQRRGYVIPRGKAMVPSFTAFAVVGILEKHFPNLVDTTFTANMESTLDAISRGEAEWVPFLDEFFHGPKGIKAQVAARMEDMDPAQARIIDLGDMPYAVKTGRFGAYVEMEVDGELVSATIPEGLTPDELTAEKVEQMVKARLDGPRSLGENEDGLPVYVMDGRYGPYYQLGDGEGKEKPKRASVPSKDIDGANMPEALKLLSLPRELGPHPEGGIVIAGMGRFGAFVAHDKQDGGKADFRSLKEEDDVYEVGVGRAMELLSVAKGGRRGAAVLQEVGNHPSGKPIQLLSGRYGPYLKCDKTNASLAKDMDPAKLTLELAIELIDAKRN